MPTSSLHCTTSAGAELKTRRAVKLPRTALPAKLRPTKAISEASQAPNGLRLQVEPRIRVQELKELEPPVFGALQGQAPEDVLGRPASDAIRPYKAIIKLYKAHIIELNRNMIKLKACRNALQS